MILLSLVLMTAWMFSVAFGFTAGGFSHVLGLASATVVFMSGNRSRSFATFPRRDIADEASVDRSRGDSIRRAFGTMAGYRSGSTPPKAA